MYHCQSFKNNSLNWSTRLFLGSTEKKKKRWILSSQALQLLCTIILLNISWKSPREKKTQPITQTWISWRPEPTGSGKFWLSFYKSLTSSECLTQLFNYPTPNSVVATLIQGENLCSSEKNNKTKKHNRKPHKPETNCSPVKAAHRYKFSLAP